MIDISFYQKFSKLKKQMLDEKISIPKPELYHILENMRSFYPAVYDIETTNICNMNCVMCPGPTKMTIPRITMPMELFEKVITQVHPYSKEELHQWYEFVEEYYGVKKTQMSENHWFLYVIPKVLVLHGYGDPLLDKYIVDRVKRCTELNIPTYFSCNPWNMKSADTGRELFEAGLDYIKFHLESVDDATLKKLRGPIANFSSAYNMIRSLLKIKEENDYKTTIVITMLDLNRPNQKEDFEKLKSKFEGLDVYIYMKSQDQLWYDQTGAKMKAIHWLEPCQFPWSTISVKSNGECCECSEDYNNEIILGNCNKQSLVDIWNGEAYEEFRWDHINMDKRIKCTQECDAPLMGNFLN